MGSLQLVCPSCGGRVKARTGAARVQTFCRDCGILVGVEVETQAVSKRRLKLGAYHLTHRIADGGMGTVYKGHHAERPDDPVAVKVMHPDAVSDEDYLARFRREAAIGREVVHPNLVHIRSCEHVGERHFMVMDLIDGCSLEDRIFDAGPVPWRDAITLVRRACAGAQALTEAGIVHRDIKAANILMTKDAEQVLLADYGLAKRLDGRGGEAEAAAMTMMGDHLGTPVFMAPEQVMDSSTVTSATDVYGLAITLYHAIAGRAPYDESGGAMAVMQLVLKSAPRPIADFVPTVPKAVSAVLDWALAKEPRNRPGTPGEFAAALDRALEQPSNPSAAVPKRALRRSSRIRQGTSSSGGGAVVPGAGSSSGMSPWAWLVVVVGILILAGGLVWLLR